MPISIACPHCDWKGRVKDELGGRKGKCPTCGELFPIPLKGTPPPVPAGQRVAVDDEPDVVDDADIVEEPASKSKSGVRRTSGSKVRREVDDDRPRRRRDNDEDDDRPSRSRQRYEEDEDDRPRTKRRARDDGYDDYDDRPRRRRKRVEKKPEHGGWFGLEKRVLGGGVIGGVIAMLVAVAWFVLGLMADRIFFYPPILFVVGLVAFIRGLVSGGD